MRNLITLSKLSKTHKRFVTVVVRRRRGMVLPFGLDFSFGMRRYQVLITEERWSSPTFDRAAGSYVLPEVTEEDESQLAVQRFTHSVTRAKKGK